jgi:hypothetical protein
MLMLFILCITMFHIFLFVTHVENLVVLFWKFDKISEKVY